MKSKLPLLSLLASALLLLLSSNLAATTYCDTPITSLSGNKSATVSCESLGSNQYRFTLVSDESFTSATNKNVGCNPGPVNIGAILSVQADNKTLTGEFTCTGAPTLYVATIFINYSSGEERFDIPLDAEFSVCGSPTPIPPTIGAVTVVSSYNGNAELAFSITGSTPITYTVTCDGNTISSGDYTYSSGKLKINSSYFTVGAHSVNITATNSEGSDSKTGIVVNTSAAPQKCGTVLGGDGSSIDYLFITNPDNSVTITINATANLSTAIVYIGAPGYIMTMNGSIGTYTHPASLIGAQTELSNIYFLYNIGAGQQSTSASPLNYTIGTICYDSESPQWGSDPSFVAASARSFVLDVNASDNIGVKGFNVKLGTCESVDVQITESVLYDGSITIPLPAGCPDLPSDAGSAKSATIEAYDAAGNVSISKIVGGIYKTITPPTMVSASCIDPIGTTTMTMAVSATNGTNNVKAYQVVSSASGYSQIFTPNAGEILLTGLTGNTSYEFNVWAIDDMDVLSENFVTCSANCKTLDPYAPDVPSKLTATPMQRTSTGNCSTSIVAGTNFAASTYDEDTYNLSYSDIVTAEGRLSNLTINSIIKESYVNGGFHDVPSSDGEYAIVSNPKVLNGKYPAKSDGKNRFIAGFSTALTTGNRLNILTYTFEPLVELSTFKVSFNYDDMNAAAVGARQLWIVIKEGSNVLFETPLDYSAGSENTYTSPGYTLTGTNQKVSVQIDARMLPLETTVALSDITIYGCMTKSIVTDVNENYVCRGTSVNLKADGFDAGTGFTWYSGTSISGPWTELPLLNTQIVAVTPELVGNNYYRVVKGSDEAVASVLAKVCCDVSGESQQKIVWKEVFETGLDPNERYQNTALDSIGVYTFATKTNTCGGGEGLGKVCDGYYVVVSNSTAAYASMCGWPSGKLDHTTSDGTGGYLIVNAGDANQLLYEKEIYPEGGFCSGVWYNFSLYATNIAPSGSSPARFTLQIIERQAGGVETELSNFDTGNIEGFSMSEWFNYGTSFTPSDLAEQIIVRIWNTGGSNNGNDLVLDDLSVSICQPKAGIFIGDIADKKKEETEVSCGTTLNLSAVLNGYQGDFFPSTPYYLWAINTGSGWSEISGASGIGEDVCSHLTQEGLSSQIKTILAGDRETALKVLNGEEVGSCSANAVTDLATISCQNNCPNPATIIWKSDSGKQNQTVCAGGSIISSRYELGGSATNYTIEGLPLYMTHSKIGLIVEISGTPTENINYTITTTGQDAGCTPATISGTIKYAEKPSASITAPQTELTCSLNEVTLTANTDAATPTYLWSNGATASFIDVSTAGDYTVTITDANSGCSTESTIYTITQNKQIPSASITAPQTELNCSLDKVTLTANTDASNPTYLWSNGATTSSIEVNAAGDYTVTITDGSNGCSAESSTATITESEDKPQAIINAVSTKLTCAVSSIELEAQTDATNVSYLWSNSSTTQSIDVTAVGNYSVTITNTDNGCSSTSSPVEITEDKAAPSASISSTSTELNCLISSISLTSSTDVSNVDYLWSNGAISADIDVTSAGTYSVVITNTDNECATTSNEIEITQNKQIPSASITAPQTELTCSLNEVTLTANTDAANPTYLWSTGATTSSIEVSAAGDYTVTITDESNGCSAESSTTNITESGDKPQAIINAVSTKLTCAVSSIELEAQTDATNVSYLWSNSSTEQSIDVTASGSYYVTITNTDNGCSSTSSPVEITEDKAAPSASISSTSTELNCLNNSISLTSSTDASNVDYLWSNGATSANIDVNSAGIYSVVITNTDNECNTTSNDIEITENKKQPTVDINPKSGSLTCADPTLVLTSSTDAVTPQYLWSNGTTESTLTVSISGNYYVTITDATNGCSIQSEEVSINDEKTYPSLTIVPENPILTCTETTVTLEAQADNVTYLWSNSSTSNTIEVSVAQEYSVTITDITTGCTNNASVVVTESINKPNVQISSQETVLTCKTTSIVLTAEADNVTYMWSDGSTESTLNVNDVGIYTVTVTDLTNGCQNSASSEEITKNIEIPQVDITSPETEITCQNQKVVLTAETQKDVDYLWDDNSILETRDVLEAGSNYWVEVTDKENGCVGRAGAPIITDVREMLDFDLQLSNEEVVLGNEAIVNVNIISGDYDKIIWQRNGEIYVPSDELQSKEKPYVDVTYTITMEGDCNTVSKDAIVKVLWPTAFMPYNTSSDLNRTFVTDMNPDFPIIVFSRYGNKIFESSNGWDGTSAGQMCMPGVYYYQVTLPNGEIKKGTIELYKE
ncbi:MAG: hypothetical protein EOL95_01610 [Bacteroidia bacterium]|nr:hypothetical protein [Bacteroidia bacterium]